MKLILSFGAGALTIFGLLTVFAAVFFGIDVEHISISMLLAGLAMLLVAPFVGAALSAAAYILGLKVFRRFPSRLSSYFIGLACALFVLVVYWLLASELVFFLPFGMYERILWPLLLCFSGFLASLLAARRVGSKGAALNAARRATAKRWVTPAILGTVGLAIVAMVVAAISVYHEHALKSEFSEAIVAANDAMTHVEDYYTRHDAFPSSNAEAGYTSTSDWKAIRSVSIGSGGVVTATFSAAVPEFSGKSDVYTPAVGADRRIRWKGCSAAGIPERYWPASCR